MTCWFVNGSEMIVKLPIWQRSYICWHRTLC